MLSSPIIMYDHPGVAPESPGDLFDAGEIDEILSLRTLTLTDAEKREARATDPRAKAIVDRVDALPEEVFARLRGAFAAARRRSGRVARARPVWDRPLTLGGTRGRRGDRSTGFASPAAAGSGWHRGVRAPTPTTSS